MSIQIGNPLATCTPYLIMTDCTGHSHINRSARTQLVLVEISQREHFVHSTHLVFFSVFRNFLYPSWKQKRPTRPQSGLPGNGHTKKTWRLENSVSARFRDAIPRWKYETRNHFEMAVCVVFSVFIGGESVLFLFCFFYLWMRLNPLWIFHLNCCLKSKEMLKLKKNITVFASHLIKFSYVSRFWKLNKYTTKFNTLLLWNIF